MCLWVGGQQKNQSFRGNNAYCGMNVLPINILINKIYFKGKYNMSKQEALKIILNCSKMYQQNLENKNILYIIQDNLGKVSYLETTFLSRNFLHLTGVKILNSKIKSSIDFYNLCLKKQLSISDFDFNSNGTTTKKLNILQSIMQIYKNAKIVGEYNNFKKYLSTEILIGSINCCLGYIKQNNYYIPNTALKEDIRDIVEDQYKVIFILRKGIKDKKYSEITYSNKKATEEKQYLNVCKKIGLNDKNI